MLLPERRPTMDDDIVNVVMHHADVDRWYASTGR
jgi:hypothetical protein